VATQPLLKAIGIRTAPQQVRYALVVKRANNYELVNRATENLIRTPAQFQDDVPGHLSWLHDEIGRILRLNPDVPVLALKAPEFVGTQTTTNRLGNYLDAIVIHAASASNREIVSKRYSQMSTRRADVKRHAEDRVGRTDANWNEQIADAVAICWAMLQ
jgi:hypothetical protein